MVIPDEEGAVLVFVFQFYCDYAVMFESMWEEIVFAGVVAEFFV